MNAERRQVGWSFWLWWVLASTGGAAIGSVVLNPVSIAMGFFVPAGHMLGSAAHGAAAGFLMWGALGIAQWFVLRLTVPWARWWVVASILGGILGFAAAQGMDARSFAFGALTGASVGTTQWLLVLRPVSRSGWYIVASAAGIVLGWAVVLPMRNPVPGAARGFLTLFPEVPLSAVEVMSDYLASYVGFVMGWATYGAVIGLVTGTVLVWLLRQSVPEA